MCGMMTKRDTFHWQSITALFLAFTAFALSAYFSATTFERLPHLEDELAYLYQAKIFAGGQFTVPSPDPISAYWQPFVVDYEGQRFGKYTPGWSVMLAIGVLMGQQWVINAFFSALNVALVYKLGARVFNRDTGLIAGVLMTFSPISLLLNATLMGHTAALFFALLFVTAYHHLEYDKFAWRWAIVSGLALGVLTIARPLTAIAISLPFIAWSGVRILLPLLQGQLAVFWRKLAPLLILSVCALGVASFIPIFNQAATGDAGQNLYLLVWDYDRIGFGEGHGRNGHTIVKAERHTRYDLSLLAADLFGWQLEPVTLEIEDHLLNRSTTYPANGYSFLLIPVGVFLAIALYAKHQRTSIGLLIVWAIVAYAWIYVLREWETLGFTEAFVETPFTALIWLNVAILGLLLPLLYWRGTNQPARVTYAWLFFCIVLGIVIAQMFYWIGSQRYSTRYYYEAIFAASLLTAIPISYLAQNFSKRVVYGLLIALCLVTFVRYSYPRVDVLYRYNEISPLLVQQINERRTTDKSLLVIIAGDGSGENRVRWRSYGELMAVTNPYLDSDIVAARDYNNEATREKLINDFPDREVIILYAIGNDVFFENPAAP